MVEGFKELWRFFTNDQNEEKSRARIKNDVERRRIRWFRESDGCLDDGMFKFLEDDGPKYERSQKMRLNDNGGR